MNLRTLTRIGAAWSALLCLADVRPALGAQVYQVSEDQSQWIVTQEQRPWGAGDPVLAMRGNTILALGVVEAANESAALVSVRRRGTAAVAAGDLVAYARDSSQVTQVITDGTEFWVTHPVHLPWLLGDAVCVARGELTVGCGRIVETSPERSKLRLAGSTAWVVVGNFVRPAFLQTMVVAVDPASHTIRMRQGLFENWNPGERACAVAMAGAGTSELACGTVGESSAAGAILKVEGSVETIGAGAWVRGKAKTAFVYQVADDQSALVITHHLGNPWVVGDAICAQRAGYEIGCGRVVQSNHLAALVELVTRSYPVAVGDQIRAAGAGNPEVLRNAAATASNESSKEEDEFRTPASAESEVELSKPRFGSFMAGVNYVFPEIRYEQSIGRGFAVGGGALLVSYSTGGGTLKGVGYFGSFAFYEGGWFRGLWLQLGGGLLSLKASLNGVEESFGAIQLGASSGWRWQWDSGINLGFGVGLNYFSRVRSDNVPLDSSRLLPSLRMDLGFAF